jgi:hypothetical protein
MNMGSYTRGGQSSNAQEQHTTAQSSNMQAAPAHPQQHEQHTTGAASALEDVPESYWDQQWGYEDHD